MPNDGQVQRAHDSTALEEKSEIDKQPSPCVDPNLSLNDVASEFRFTLEEVEEYYAKHKDVARTRARFKRMRDVLNNLEDEA